MCKGSSHIRVRIVAAARRKSGTTRQDVVAASAWHPHRADDEDEEAAPGLGPSGARAAPKQRTTGDRAAPEKRASGAREAREGHAAFRHAVCPICTPLILCGPCASRDEYYAPARDIRNGGRSHLMSSVSWWAQECNARGGPPQGGRLKGPGLRRSAHHQVGPGRLWPQGRVGSKRDRHITKRGASGLCRSHYMCAPSTATATHGGNDKPHTTFQKRGACHL